MTSTAPSRPLRGGYGLVTATVAVLAVTAVLTVLQLPFPEVRLAPWRDPDAIAAGQWWRLARALFVRYDPVWQIIAVLACVAAIGVVAERVFGPGRWLLSPAGPRLVRVRVWGVVWPLIGIVLTVNREMHGPPLLAGFGLGALLLWWGPAQHVRELPG